MYFVRLLLFYSTIFSAPFCWAMLGVGFNAPVYLTKDHAVYPETGAIIFDSTLGTFFGNTGNSGTPAWVAFSRPAFWYIDANISGSDVTLGTSAVGSYADINSGSLSLAKNGNSEDVGIACSTPATETQEVGDTTCTGGEGNESLGITFQMPNSGVVKICSDFGHRLNLNSTGLVDAVFQIVETANTSMTILQYGNSKVNSRAGAASAIVVTHPLDVCGIFSFSTSGQKTIRLMYSQAATATITENVVLTDSAGVGGRNLHWTVIPLDL